MSVTEYESATTAATAAFADLMCGDHRACDRFCAGVVAAAACRGDVLNVRPVLDDVINRFGARLSAKLTPILEAISPFAAEAADQALVDAMANMRAAVAEAFPG
jgi:hypothetical protein